MKSSLFLLILLTIFTTSAMSQENQTVTLKGIIRDYKSKMPLATQIKIIYTDSQLNTQESNSKGDGSFEIKTLPKQCVFQAKTNGYIVSNVLMNLENLSESTAIAEIPLVFNGRSKINQLLLEFSERKKEKEAEQDKGIPINKQVFQAVDALENKAIPAQFRLTGTYKNKVINKATSREASVFDHNFTEREHLMVEVMAEGYQKFLSEIDIETFDETVHENTAKLIKKISFLNLIIKNEVELQNVNIFEVSGGTQKQIVLSKTNNMYLGQLKTGGSYKISINSNTEKEVIREFLAVEGVNQVLVVLEPKKKKQTNFANSIAVETKTVQMEKQAYTAEKKPFNLEQKTLFFDQSSCVLKPESKQILEEISKQLLDSPDVNIEITGYADNIGDARQNQYLSEFRAKVISNYLFNKGVKDNRIKLKGDGGKKAENDTEDARQRNRRAELRFY
ncbi:OmpA family protein [Emticicia oligotrophica]|uniref:OmpA family protein n=1 Tax=Emticicia oligotrophica TaxID=312279 RepID=UPI00273C7FB1|nr:OmpA family protein [Emticicia oligotrophica]